MKKSFPGSKRYWEDRYKNGGTSGNGSYGKLAEFKAEIIQQILIEKKISSVIEFGCGDGNQMSLINFPYYIGLDISPTAIKKCQKMFRKDINKEFYIYSNNLDFHQDKLTAEMGLSLDVIYHLVEEDIYYKYMEDLFTASQEYVLIYSSNSDNLQKYHEKDRKFTEWISRNKIEWSLKKVIKNRFPYSTHNINGSKSDFYLYEKQS